VSRTTWEQRRKGLGFAYRALTVCGWPFQVHSARLNLCNFLRRLQPPLALSRNPDWTTLAGLTSSRFRLVPVRSPLLGESRLLSFPRGTEMFHFPRFPLPRLFDSAKSSRDLLGRVAPFGDPWINACVQLPRAYRSLPRPSSASSAKASTVRP
jgi:hypothetical protein